MSSAVVFTLAALGTEVLLLLLVFLTVSWFRNRAMRLRDLRAIRALVARVRQEAPEREKAIGQYLEQALGLSDEALVEARADLARAELGLLQRFASVYGQRAAAAAARFDSDLFAALEPYRVVRNATEASAMGGDVDVQLDALQEENRRLSKELQVSMENMSRMLKEYSTMFAAGPPESASPVQNPDAKEQGGLPSEVHAAATRPIDDDPDLDDADVSLPNAGDGISIGGRARETTEPGELQAVMPAEDESGSTVGDTVARGDASSPAAGTGGDGLDTEAGSLGEGDVEVMGLEETDGAVAQGERDLLDSAGSTTGIGDGQASGAAGADGEDEVGQLDDEELLSIRSGA